jgi:hypothetical protein
MRLRSVAHRLRRRRPAEPSSSLGGYIRHEPSPDDPDPIHEFALCAVVKTWMDEDIVEATVRNLQTQGVDAVYLVDNASSDDTVQIARSAGAELGEIYETSVFDGPLAQTLMNAVAARETLRRDAAHTWWLYLDSDEFPEGPQGTTLRDYLSSLDRRFRTVGASYVNHFPSAKPEYVSGFHPIDFQPLCYDFAPARWPPCEWGHWKHPLQRLDKNGRFVVSNDGAHSALCNELLKAPMGGVVTHHFQYREEAATRAKLELTCGPGSARTTLHEAVGFDGFARRRSSLDAVYSGRWADVETIPNVDPSAALHPRPWPGLATVHRWYRPDELTAARAQWETSSPAETGADVSLGPSVSVMEK